MGYPIQVQWNLSIENTIETKLAGLYKEVSLIQTYICTQFHVIGTTEVSFIQSVLYKEVSQ